MFKVKTIANLQKLVKMLARLFLDCSNVAFEETNFLVKVSS